MRTIPIVFLIMLLIAGCSSNKCDEMHCGYNQQCSNNTCGCIDWYEGSDCRTAMRQKWVGTFIGSGHIGASLSSRPDTFTFVTDATRIDYDYCINKRFDLSIRNTREASFYDGSGVGIVSEDGKYVTLTYPSKTLQLDSNIYTFADTFYTFTGVKQ